MVSVEFAEDRGLSNEHLIEQLHKDLDIEDSSADANDPKSVSLRQQIFFCRQFWDKMLGPMSRLHPEQKGMTDIDSNPIDVTKLEERIAAATSPHKISELLSDAIDGTIVVAVCRFHAHYDVYLQKDGPDSHPMLRRYADAEQLLGERLAGSSLEKILNLKGMRFMDVLKSGMNTVRGITMKLFAVAPEVSKVQNGRVLSDLELRQVCRNTVNLTRPIAKSHISVFDHMRVSLMQTEEGDTTLKESVELEYPLDPLQFEIVRRKERLMLKLSPKFLDSLRQDLVQAKQRKPDLFNEPRVGCPGNIIIPDVHRWIYSIADKFYFPAVEKLESGMKK